MKASTLMLSTGDTLIAQLQEIFKGEGDNKKGLCLQVKHPYLLELVDVDTSEGVQVKFTRWMAFSSEFEFKLPYGSVLTIGEPQSDILKAYEKKVETAEAKIKADSQPPEPVYASDVSVAGLGMGGGFG